MSQTLLNILNGKTPLAEVVNHHSGTWLMHLLNALNEATTDENRSYYTHEIDALTDIQKACLTEMGRGGAVGKEMLLPGDMRLVYSADQWVLFRPEQSGAIAVRGIGHLLADELYRRDIEKHGPYAGHSSLADMVSTHISVWRDLLDEGAKSATNIASQAYYRDEGQALKDIEEACAILNPLEGANVTYDQKRRFPLQIELKGSILEPTLGCRHRGAWVKSLQGQRPAIWEGLNEVEVMLANSLVEMSGLSHCFDQLKAPGGLEDIPYAVGKVGEWPRACFLDHDDASEFIARVIAKEDPHGVHDGDYYLDAPQSVAKLLTRTHSNALAGQDDRSYSVGKVGERPRACFVRHDDAAEFISQIIAKEDPDGVHDGGYYLDSPKSGPLVRPRTTTTQSDDGPSGP